MIAHPKSILREVLECRHRRLQPPDGLSRRSGLSAEPGHPVTYLSGRLRIEGAKVPVEAFLNIR